MLSCFPLTLWITLSFSPLLVFLLGTSERQRAPTLSSWTSSMHLDLFFIFMHSFDNLMLSYRYIYIITILYYIKIYTLGSITMSKASGGDGIPVELFQILKDDAVKVMHSICQQIWKTQQWPQDWKRSVFISIPKKVNAKECQNYYTIAFITHASKVMLKILQARLQQYVNRELPGIQAGFWKGRGTTSNRGSEKNKNKNVTSQRQTAKSGVHTEYWNSYPSLYPPIFQQQLHSFTHSFTLLCKDCIVRASD